MKHQEKYELLRAENLVYKKTINNPLSSIDEKIIAKKKMYSNKIEMLNLIHEKEEAQRTGLNALAYIKRAKSKKAKPKYSTGIERLDRNLENGFETGILVNVAGESFAGKTELCMNIVANMANSKKVAWFNFEMGEKLFTRRLEKLNMTETQAKNLYINEDARNIDKLFEEMELLIQEGYFCFGIDSKMKITGGLGKEDYQKFSNISTRLAEFAQTKDIIIIFINQMNEDDIKNKRLALKGSGDQKYDSDIVLFLVLEEDPTKKKVVEDLNRYLVCTKNRLTEKTFRIQLSQNEYKYRNQVEETTYIENMNISENNSFLSDITE